MVWKRWVSWSEYNVNHLCPTCQRSLNSFRHVSEHGHPCVNMKSFYNSSPPTQNGHHFTDDVYICIFMDEKFCILIQISLKFVPKGSNANKSVLVQVMPWRWKGDKLLPEPILAQFTDAYAAPGGDELILKQPQMFSHIKYCSSCPLQYHQHIDLGRDKLHKAEQWSPGPVMGYIHFAFNKMTHTQSY